MTDSTNNASGSTTRIMIIVLLAFIAYTLCGYAPLVPKVVTFMDDVHVMRSQADRLQQTAVGIQKSLESLQKKFDFFKQEAERKGKSWPDQQQITHP